MIFAVTRGNENASAANVPDRREQLTSWTSDSWRMMMPWTAAQRRETSYAEMPPTRRHLHTKVNHQQPTQLCDRCEPCSSQFPRPWTTAAVSAKHSSDKIMGRWPELEYTVVTFPAIKPVPNSKLKVGKSAGYSDKNWSLDTLHKLLNCMNRLCQVWFVFREYPRRDCKLMFTWKSKL